MKVLLIFPPLMNPASRGPIEMILDEAGSFPPLGLLHIATPVVAQKRHEIKIIDSILDKLTHDDLENIIRHEKPDVVGIPLNTEYLRDGFLVAKTVKKVDPSIKVIVGGPHVYVFPKETIELPQVDIAVRGEADEVFAQLLNRIADKKSIDDLPGVIVKGKNYEQYPLAIIEDPQKLMRPDRRLVKYERYASIIAQGSPITTIMSSRGCCFKCPFCPAGGVKLRDNPVELVMAEIDDCLKLGIKDILFFDELFTINKKRTLEICDEIIKRGYKFRWHIRTRIQSVDAEIIQALRKAGCVLIQYGIESGTDRIQSVLGKNLPLDVVEKVVKMTRASGILVYGNFMLASPTETIEEIEATVDFAIKINVDFAIFSLTRLIPGTGFYKEAIEKGQVEDFWQKYAKDPLYTIPRAYCPGEFDDAKLKEIASKAYRRFYMRPAYVFNYLTRIFNLNNSFSHFKAGINLLLGSFSGK